MQSVALGPRRAELTALVISLAALCVAMLVLPGLCLPLSLLTPLLGCPLVRRREEPVAWAAAAMPLLASLLAGDPAVYAVSLALVGLLPLAFTRFAPPAARVGLGGMLCYVGCIALSLIAVALSATLWLGAPLWQTLSARLCARVEGSERAGEWLLRLAAAGLLRLPKGYGSGFARAIPAAFTKQMALSLQLSLQRLLQGGLPALWVQLSLLVGLFTCLRVSRFCDCFVIVETVSPGERRARVSAPPGFGQWALPRALRSPVLSIGVLSLGLMLFGGDYAATLGQLGYTLFETAFMLNGAAVVVGLGAARDEDRKALWGLLAAALYLIAPLLLFLLGAADQGIHFRKRSEPSE